MTTRTYTYTLQDYIDVLQDHGRIGHAGVDPDGDLVWTRRADIVWAYETLVIDWPKAMQYSAEMARGDVLYAPSAMQRDEFEARQ